MTNQPMHITQPATLSREKCNQCELVEFFTRFGTVVWFVESLIEVDDFDMPKVVAQVDTHHEAMLVALNHGY